MIHPHELRIGNLLQLNPEKQWMGGGDRLTIVESISGKGINYTNYPESGLVWQELDDNDRCCPIPLTEEWLTKFGFTKVWHLSRHEYVLYISDLLNIEGVSDYEKDGRNLKLKIRLVVSPDTYVGDEEPHSVNYLTLIHIDYVHQLQNLYFALTGSELTINE